MTFEIGDIVEGYVMGLPDTEYLLIIEFNSHYHKVLDIYRHQICHYKSEFCNSYHSKLVTSIFREVFRNTK